MKTNSAIDFLMIHPHDEIQAYSQRILLGVLKEAGHSVHLLIVASVQGIKNNPKLKGAFLRMIEQSSIVGFGFMSTGYPEASYLTKLIKENFPQKPVVWGGPHPTINYRNMMGEADALFIGESDVTLPRYVKAVLNNKPFDHIPYVMTERQRQSVPPTREYYLSNLDELPLPFFSMDGQTLITQDHIQDDPEYFHKNFGSFHLLTSRGCPYACTYCCNSYLSNLIPEGVKHFRKRSVEHVIREIQFCRQVYNFGSFIIEDDLFFARPTEDLENFVEQCNRHLPYLSVGITGITPSFLTPHKMEVIRRLPLDHLRVGIQTVSENGLTIYGRKTPNKYIERTLGYLKGLYRKGIMIRYDMILDNPYETEADGVETLRFLSRLSKPFRILLYHLTMFEGTVLRETAIRDGVIDPNDRNYTTRHYRNLDDTYVNALFLLLEATEGLIPQRVMTMLTSPRVLNTSWLKEFLKRVIKFIVKYLHKGSSQRWIFRFCRLMSGHYNREFWKRKYFTKKTYKTVHKSFLPSMKETAVETKVSVEC